MSRAAMLLSKPNVILRNLWAAIGLLIGVTLVGCGLDKPLKEDKAPTQPKLDAPIKAQAGVGKQGQSLKNESGVGRMVPQPAITLFAVKQRVVFEIQLPQAMNLFQAEKGYFPRTHDEFMNMIIKANNINLPQLPEGQVYQYHPDTHDLWVHPVEK